MKRGDFMDKTLFGIFHTAYERSGEYFYRAVKADYINTFIVESDYRSEEFAVTMNEIRKYKNKCAFIAVSGLGFSVENDVTVADTGKTECAFNPKAVFLKDYKRRVNEMIGYLKEKGWYDSVEGFYMDEPLLWNIKREWLKAFTRYFRTQAAPEKRFFVCFSVAGVAPEVWTINNIRPITPVCAQYLTDVAFDMYHPWSEEYAKILKLMEKRTGKRKDLKLWMIPCTMNYRGDKTEEHCLTHLEKCYETLKQAENPGGLMCFTYYTFSAEEEDLGNIGLDKLGDPSYNQYWKRLIDRTEEIGREIVGGKFDEDREKRRIAKTED